jgi:hypothetical protein
MKTQSARLSGRRDFLRTLALIPEQGEGQIGKLLRFWKTGTKLFLLSLIQILRICWGNLSVSFRYYVFME